jgi:hypothetical protein
MAHRPWGRFFQRGSEEAPSTNGPKLTFAFQMAGKEWIMATQRVTSSENSVDKIVRKLDEFPELLEALRDCDLLTARSFCARLFNLDERQRPRELTQTGTFGSSMKAF